MPDEQVNDYAVELGLLKETATNPKRISYGANPLTGDTELVRVFTTTRDESAARLLTVLNDRSCADGKPGQQYVDDPKADGVVYPGRFRVVSNRADLKRTNPELQGVVQTLRREYVEEISNDPVQWYGARLLQNPAIASDDDNLFVQWVNISPKKVHAIAESLSSTTYVNPVIRGEPYSGTWYRISCLSTIAEDGSGVVTLHLCKGPFSQTFYQAVGTLKPETVVRHFGVPKTLISTLIAGYDSASDRQTKSIDIQYSDGKATITASTVSIVYVDSEITFASRWDTKETQRLYLNVTKAEAEAIASALNVARSTLVGKEVSLSRSSNGDKTYDVSVVIRDMLQGSDAYDREHEYTIASGFDSEENVVTKWNCTETEVDAFITANLLDTAEEGKSKRLERSRDGTSGLFTVTAVISTTDLLSSLDVSSFGAIDGELTGCYDPNKEAEVREYTWFNVADSAADSMAANLRSATFTDWAVTQVIDRVSKSNGTHELSFTIAKKGTATHQTQIRNLAGDVEQITVTLLNRFTAPVAEPSIADYVMVEKAVSQRGKALTDYIYVFSREGTTAHTTTSVHPSADAQQITVTLLNRSTDPGAVAVTDYALVERQTNRAGEPQPDYVYRYVKIGATEIDERFTDYGAAGEVVQVTLINRTSEPTDPTRSGYALVTKQRNKLGEVVSDWVYVFVKIGTEEVTVETRYPTFVGEEVTLTLFNRTSEPSAPAPGGYTLVGMQKRNPIGTVADYVYTYIKNGDGVTPYIVAYLTPAFMERKIELYPNVPDAIRAATMLVLRTTSDDTQVVEDVRSDFNGRGVSNITRTLILLPDELVENETVIEPRDSALQPSSFSVISAYQSYTSDSKGTTSYTPTVIKVPTAFWPGHTVRKLTITKTTTYHKTKPTAPSSTGTYLDQTTYKIFKMPNGVWIKEVVNVVRTAWDTSV